MNCKQGDLAVVIKSESGNEGRIVRLVRLHSSTTHDLDGIPVLSKNKGPRWVLDVPLTTMMPSGRIVPLYTFPDASLRPIRDPGDDAQDESKAWLPPVPTEEHA